MKIEQLNLLDKAWSNVAHFCNSKDLRAIPIFNVSDFYFFVDAKDYDKVIRHHWSIGAIARPLKIDNDTSTQKYCYAFTLMAATVIPKKNVSLGRFLCGLHEVIGAYPCALNVSKNVFDGRRSNFRVATAQEKQAFKRKPASNTAGFKGVFPQREASPEKKYRAAITVGGKVIGLGGYPTPALAHAAYTARAKELFGEFHNPG